MKKLGIYILALSLISNFSFTNVKAETYPLPDGDMTITQNVIDVGEAYADMMEEKSRLTRTDEEVWTLVGNPITVVGYGTLKGTSPIIVPSGSTQSNNFSWSINVGTSVNGYQLGATISGSRTISKSGPAEGTKLCDGKYATHRSFFALGEGKIVQYNYLITSKYTGAYIDEKTVYLAADVYTEECSQLLSKDGSYYQVENGQRTKTVRVYGETYRAKFLETGSGADNYYNF